MPVDYRVFFTLAPFMAAVLFLVALLAWNQRERPGGRYLVLFSYLAFADLATNSFELVADSAYWTLFWARIEHIWGGLMPVAWIAFVFSFAVRRDTLRFRHYWPFFVVPAADVALTYTNSSHHLIWKSIRFVPVGHSLAMQPVHGPIFFATTAYAYVLLIGGLALITREFLSGHGVYRRQLLWISGGIVVPVLISAVYSFHLIPSVHKDFTPLGFAIGALMFLVAVYGNRFLVLAPISRSRVFDAMSDGVITLDENWRIVDMNRSAMAFFNLDEGYLGMRLPRDSKAGALLDRISPDFDVLRTDISVTEDSRTSNFELTLIRIPAERDGRDAALLVVHDVTERVRLNEEVRTLRGIIPMCAHCKKIRDEDGSWLTVEEYVSARSHAEFSHGLCPNCMDMLYPDVRRTKD